MPEEKLKLEDLFNETQHNENDGRIDYVAIIGAGVMGQGIAQTCASAGLDVLIIEKDDDNLQHAQIQLKESMKREIARWGMTDSEMKSVLSRIKWSININDIADYDLIIEAVAEDFNLKCSLFKKMDEIVKPETILISNTSTLSLTKIAENTTRPQDRKSVV